MSIIKQISVYNGNSWIPIHDIGANATNVSLSTNAAGANNVQGALNNLIGTTKLTGDRIVITGSNGQLTTANNVNPNKIQYLDKVESDIQDQLDAKAPIESPQFTGTPILKVENQGIETIKTIATLDDVQSRIEQNYKAGLISGLFQDTNKDGETLAPPYSEGVLPPYDSTTHGTGNNIDIQYKYQVASASDDLDQYTKKYQNSSYATRAGSSGVYTIYVHFNEPFQNEQKRIFAMAGLLSTSGSYTFGQMYISTFSATKDGFYIRIFNASSSNKSPQIYWIAGYCNGDGYWYRAADTPNGINYAVKQTINNQEVYTKPWFKQAHPDWTIYPTYDIEETRHNFTDEIGN